MFFFIHQDNAVSDSSNDHLSVHLQQLGERLYPKVGTEISIKRKIKFYF